MRAMLQSAVEPLRVTLPAESAFDTSLSPQSLLRLGERLRATYHTVDEPLPVRLSELVERLDRREQAER